MNKQHLTQVVPNLPKPTEIPPSSNLEPLTEFLETNDCSRVTRSVRDIKICYELTRALLIQNTNKLDKEALNFWVANRTIAQLIDNLNVVIDGINQTKEDQ